MRSPNLPDRITQDVLCALTVELEVLGPPRGIVEADLVGAIVPGATGLSVRRGGAVAYVLPSEAYEHDMDHAQMRRRCLSGIPISNESASQRPRWSIFGTRHYIGSPDGTVVSLCRGKIVVPHDSIDEAALNAAAETVGVYLLRNQTKAGRYQVSGRACSLRDHLWATWAVGRLARCTEHAWAAKSANAALGYAATFVRQEGQLAYIQTESPQDQLAATALAALAIGQMPPSTQGDKLRGQLLAALARAIGEGGRLVSRLDGEGRPVPATEGDSSLALLAMQDGGIEQTKLGSAKGRLTALTPVTGEGLLWKARAGLGPLRLEDLGDGPSLRWIDEKAVADERGGCAVGKEAPRTVLAGLFALAPSADKDQRLAARRFCYQMMYKAREAYFADRPEDWIGAVRARPGSAKVTLRACAAGLEAFLVGGRR
ncbi:MAG: hypothetical protein KAX78_05815, partial [Phycisphaerae bacterium]|nr:hypothetical protein [Phycisphaerae bacterium]